MSIKNIINSSKAPEAIGPYSQAVCVNAFVFTSGQLPVDSETGKIVGTEIKEQAEQVFKNIEAILHEADMTLENIVKTTVFLTDMNDFVKFNEIYSKYITKDFPSRSCVQVAALPLGAKVEIETICTRGYIPYK